MAYEIGKCRGHTVLMWDDDIPDNDIDEDMYVNQQDYSVWYKGQRIGYMTKDKSCINPFYDEIYNNLKSSKEKVKKENFKEVASAAESIPTSSLLDTESEVEQMLKSVKDYCGAEVLGDEVFAELTKELEVLMGEREE